MSKLRPSTLAWALSKDLLTQGWTIASPSSMPRVASTLSKRSEPKIRIKSSSRLRKNEERPASPWRPDRPRSWLSILRLSCRSVASTNKPPALKTFSLSPEWEASIFVLNFSGSSFGLLAKASRTFISTLPPSWISVPRPAMFVAIVTAPSLPASPTIWASCSCCLAFKTLCFTFSFFSISDSSSDFSIEVVPTNTGWPLVLASLISSIIAVYFSAVVR